MTGERMMWLTRREQATLSMLGAICLALLGVRWWQQRRPPLSIAGAPTAAQAAEWDRRLAVARTVNVNTATAAELERLPEIGPALAEQIVDDRARRGTFADARDVQRVKGIGPHTYGAIRDYIVTEE